ncbi:WD40-repeat-containing domain protein [Mycotypha africana]|uniref:WD40-repeat-containing domain protein n=1 Tax=Mycotypha africana TaxID=64632 RepID=UPI002300552F|nr:WD40-repeat-containing domain protein [Mycotypha africana]KAI8972008.1 WD40-repeat-containing domain protein [Mycotypha africana]
MDVLPSQRQPPSSSKSSGLSGGSPSTAAAVAAAAAAAAAATSTGVNNRDQQVEKLLKEVKQLKQKVDILDKENNALKKSIYDLSARYAASISQGGLSYRPGPFVIDSQEIDSSSVSTVNKKAQEMISKAVQEAGGDIEPFQSIYPHDSRDAKTFELRYDLKGHTGAVYTVEFSPNGALLASGSFDKTVRIWDTSAQKEIFCLKAHSLNISDLAWTPDSTILLSGAYDETCKLWDIENGGGKLTGSYETEGLVQCVGWDFVDSNLFYYGTSRKVLAMVDVRSDGNASVIRNDSMINALYTSRDGIHVITGDAQGMLKTWDMRSRQCISSKLNDESKMPITHISIGRRSTDASRRAINDYDEPRYMAVNSYDNLLRVYDRGIDPPKSDLRLVHSLKGFKNKNWPIKSSFYCGSGYNSCIMSKPSVNDSYGDSDLLPNSSDYLFENTVSQEPKEEKSVLLATGSVDPYAYLYNVGEDSAELMQQLEGHTDRVYAVQFHPTEPILASCSADFTVKVWGPSLKHRGKKKATL